MERSQDKENEIIEKLRIYEEQLMQLQQQSQAVDGGLSELDLLNSGLDEIKNSVGKEILAQIGHGIFVRAELKSDDLTVNIGGKNFVKKSIPETKRILTGQIKKLSDLKKELEEKTQETQKEAERIMNEAVSIS